MNLLLIIVRHGEAEPKSSGKPDDQRALTDAGKTELRRNLMVAKDIVGPKIDLILSSPLLRARESAKIAKQTFGVPKLEISSFLESGSSPYEVYRLLSKYSKAGSVMLVSHQPLVSQLLSGLLNWDARYFFFGTGTIAIIEVKEFRENAVGVLFSLLPLPERLRENYIKSRKGLRKAVDG